MPASVIALLALYLAAAGAPFLAPYEPEIQHREHPFAAPTAVHVRDADGRWHRPFVYAQQDADHGAARVDDRSQRYPLRLFARQRHEAFGGLEVTARHLVSVDAPARLFVLGTDRYGRDQFSRLLHGGRASLGAGLLAAGLSVVLGLVLGGVSGTAGSVIDHAIMRAAELFLAVPWLYLLLAVRAALPLDIDPQRALFLVAAVIGLAGWARPARLVRGMVLSLRRELFVEAARSCGGSDAYLLRRHVLPQTLTLAVTQLSILIPRYTLAEMTLSFFGLGLAEPMPSWGSLLADIMRDHLLAPSWWAAAPVLFVVGVYALYQFAADAVVSHANPVRA